MFEAEEQEVARLEKQLKRLERELAEIEKEHGRKVREIEIEFSRLKSYARHCTEECARLGTEAGSTLLKNQATRTHELFQKLPPYFREDWEGPRMLELVPERSARTPFITGGEISDPSSLGGEVFRVPKFMPFIGRAKTVVLQGASTTSACATRLMQALILRSAVMVPHQCKFTFLDPYGQGRAFPMSKDLPVAVRQPSLDLYQELEEIVEEVARIIRTYLDDHFNSFEKLPDIVRLNEHFEFVFAANFPKDYQKRDIELLQRISRNGPFAGKYVCLQYDPEYPLPRGIRMEDFDNLWILDLDEAARNVPAGFAFRYSAAPSTEVQKQILENLRKAKPPEFHIDFEDLVEPNPDQWWAEKSCDRVEVSVGTTGNRSPLQLWFGVNKEGRPCAHGMLGAMPGAGKSNLYHAMICGLALRYSPEQLALYLIDGKDGVEFQAYQKLPHAKVVVLNSLPELSRSVLSELLQEKERRNELFARTGVVDLASYHGKGQPLGLLPRIVLLVDEYQELFEDDREGTASKQLLQLAQQGRSVGIHMLLGSQRFGVPGMLHQAAIFGNTHLRIAMKMALSDIQALTEFGREAKRLIGACTLPGKIVVNDQSGDDCGNQYGRVALLDGACRLRLVEDLTRKADREISATRPSQPLVFDGKSQPNLIEVPFIAKCLAAAGHSHAKLWQDCLSLPEHKGGIGEEEWFEGEHPRIMWVGQEYNIHGFCRVTVRRHPLDHVLLSGAHHPARYGMLAAMICSLALSPTATRTEVRIIDRGIPGWTGYGILNEVFEKLLKPLPGEHAFTADLDQAVREIEAVHEQLLRRRPLSDQALDEQPTIVVFVVNPDRIPALLRVPGKYGIEDSALGRKFKELYAEGAELGLHLVLAFTAVAPMAQIMDKGSLDRFRHRVAMQMSEDESFTFVRSRRAAVLQSAGPKPVSALYFDFIGGKERRFKPFSTESPKSFSEQADQIAESVKGRYEHG